VAGDHFWLFPLLRTHTALYEAANKLRSAVQRTCKDSETKKDIIMAVTPSKDYKRREREQRKLDKRMAREAAKEQELAAQQAAAQAAAQEAYDNSEEGIKAKQEAEFEAELEAERQSQKVA